ncbi:Transmembrane domain-containing protein [Spironucleus salmonicida]|uniref:Transmembrane domain-containing protein n=1 Tax=Spironucleus salmonicida TaxID=348837 RepID=V6LLX5_9EUKA|nr:Transmembrane domain-containing protein [Spironucleus salmonicida]|eukprot:EST44711.1 Transmembrane domain-containing protein [Spironucleus salmonicida]
MFLTLNVILIEKADDFRQLNILKDANFAILTDLTIQVSESSSIKQFSGALSGARNTLKITDIQQGSMFIENLSGFLSNIRIILEFEIQISILLIQQLNGATIYDSWFLIESSNINNNVDISYFNEIFNSEFTRCNFAITCNIIFKTDVKIFGLSKTIDSLNSRFLHINLQISNSSQVFGLCKMLNNGFPVAIVLDIKDSNQLFGIASSCVGTLSQVKVNIIGREVNEIYGISQNANNIISCQIILEICSYSSLPNINIYGVTDILQGNIAKLKLQIRVISQNAGNIFIDQIAQQINYNIKISNIAIQSYYEKLDTTFLITLLARNSIENVEIASISCNSSLLMENSQSQGISYFYNNLKNVQLDEVSLNLTIKGDHDGEFSSFGIGKINQNCKFTNISYNFNIQINKIGYCLNTYSLGLETDNLVIQNASFHNYINIKQGQYHNKGVIFGICKSIKSSILNYIIVQNEIKIELLGISQFSGVAEKIMDTNINFIIVSGNIELQNTGMFFGVVPTFKRNILKNLLMNFVINTPESSNCDIMFDNSHDNKLYNIVDQSTVINSVDDAFIVVQQSGNIYENMYIVNASGKQNGSYTISYDAMKAGAEVNILLATGDWIVDQKNSGLVRLKGFFSVDITGFVEEVIPEIQPFTQQQIKKQILINIKNQENLCILQCQGTFNGRSLTCKDGYKGQNCDEYQCKPGFCQDGVSCDELKGCQCKEGKTGEQCQIDLCKFCFGGANSCNFIPKFPRCNNDQTSTCYHGQVVNNLCICFNGYANKYSICDTFECRNKLDCNDNTCYDRHCHCSERQGGISCQFCIDPNQEDCKTPCSKEWCQYGVGCVYLTGNSGIWECSACLVGYKSPLCKDCVVGYVKQGQKCLQKCEECHTGDCYFLEPCAQPAAQCNTKCVSCLPGISGERCDKCPVGQQFYEYSCYPLEDEKLTNGVCIKIESKTICFSCLADFILIDDQCIFQCLPTNCINGECQPDQSCLCKRYALGKHCDSCQSGTGSFMGQCLQICNGCNGDCYYDRGEIVCSSCNDNFQGPTCQGCQIGFINIGTECLEVCQKCQGDRCYITISGNFVCLGPCQAGYILGGCFTCDTSNGFVAALGGCFQQCTTCPQGTCFQTPSGIQCSSCSGSFTGQQCDVCLDGFVFAEGMCHTQVTDDECYIDGTGNMICLQCLAGKVLVDQQCLVKCVLPDCAGECYHKVPSHFCRSCYIGFIFHENKCYPPTSNPNGDCFVLQDRTLCSCYKGYAGPSCDECSELEKGGSCYYRNDVATGSCFSNADDSLDSFCQQCQYNYAMPLCLSCAMGYAMDSSGECNECQPGYTSSNSLPPSERAIIGDNRCLISCADCAQGNCFYAGESILCASCSPGYAISTNCLQCEDGFAEFGGYCLTSGTSSCGEDNSGDTYCTTCGPQQQSFNCSLCTVEGTFGSDCKQHATHFPGECYQTSSTVTCTDAPCLSFDIASNQCLICRSDLINIKGYCGTITLPQNDKLRGNCINVGAYQVCGTCQKGWSGNICSECDKGYTTCECHTEQFSRCCCLLESTRNGVCYKSQWELILCEYCGPNYILVSKRCVKQIITSSNLLKIILISLLIILILVVILVFIFKTTKRTKRLMIIYSKKRIKHIGPHLVFVILSQALAIIIAIQDVYIDDFFMQISVNIFSMIPFILVFFFLAVPTYKQFFYNLPSHFFLFVLSALIELSFHFVQYIAVTDVVQDFGEQIYKIAGPLVTLFMCIFLAGFRFKLQQKLSVFIAVALPIVTQIVYAIQKSLDPGYFSQSSDSNIMFGQLMVYAAIVLNGAQFYLFDIILGKYGEVGAIGRLSIASFIVNGTIGIIYPGEIFNAVLQYDVFFSSLCTQIFFNVINVIIMMHISAVEFGINLISSAIWAQFITSIGDFEIARRNNYSSSQLEILLQSVSLIIVFVSLLYFNLQGSHWYHRKNVRLQEGYFGITGVKRIFKTRKQYVQYLCDIRQQENPDKNNIKSKKLLAMMLNNDSTSNDDESINNLTKIPNSTFEEPLVINYQQPDTHTCSIKQYNALGSKLTIQDQSNMFPTIQLASQEISYSPIKADLKLQTFLDVQNFK